MLSKQVLKACKLVSLLLVLAMQMTTASFLQEKYTNKR